MCMYSQAKDNSGIFWYFFSLKLARYPFWMACCFAVLSLKWNTAVLKRPMCSGWSHSSVGQNMKARSAWCAMLPLGFAWILSDLNCPDLCHGWGCSCGALLNSFYLMFSTWWSVDSFDTLKEKCSTAPSVKTTRFPMHGECHWKCS